MRFVIFLVLLFPATLVVAQELSTKIAVPDEAAQKSSLALIADVYKPDYEKAKTSSQKIELAKKLLGEGIATKDDAIARFVLFRIARDIAAQQGDLPTAFDAIGRICLEFDANRFQMQVDAATATVKTIKTPKDHQSCAAILTPLIDEAISADQYDHAKSLAALALGCAKEGREPSQIKQVTAKAKELEEIAAEFVLVQEAKGTLAQKPTDGDANFAVGKFLCFVKGDWRRGIAMLALGSDEAYMTAALLELDEKPDARKLGDAWWSISEKLDGVAKSRTQAHSVDWYTKALPGLTGLTKAKVEKRLGESPTTPPPTTSLVPTKSKSDNKPEPRHALILDGSQSYGSIPSFRYDGTHPITVEAKILASRLAVSFPIGQSTGSNGFNIQIDDKAWIFSVGTRSQRMTHVFAGGIEGNTWVHVAGVCDGTNVGIFLNGKLRDRKPLDGAILPSDSPLMIGMKKGRDKMGNEKTWYFGGAIREVRLSKTVRYSKDFTVPARIEADKDTLVFLPFEEGEGNLASDTSGNKHDANLFSCGWSNEVSVRDNKKARNRDPKPQIEGRYRTDDFDQQKSGDLLVELDSDEHPVLRRTKDGTQGNPTVRSKQIGKAWIFDWGGPDLFAIMPQPDGGLVYSVFWKDCNGAFAQGAIPNRAPDKAAKFVRVK